MNGLNPGQMVIKIVNEELIALMGSESAEIQLTARKSHYGSDDVRSAGCR